LNSLEKNSFLKIIDSILSEKPKNTELIDKILSESSRDLKNIDNINISKVFVLVENVFASYVKNEFLYTTQQLDILIDIISREGNSIMKQDWFARLYENELISLEKKLKYFQAEIDNEKSEMSEQRRKDYKIYKACLHIAYHNDAKNNQDL